MPSRAEADKALPLDVDVDHGPSVAPVRSDLPAEVIDMPLHSTPFTTSIREHAPTDFPSLTEGEVSGAAPTASVHGVTTKGIPDHSSASHSSSSRNHSRDDIEGRREVSYEVLTFSFTDRQYIRPLLPPSPSRVRCGCLKPAWEECYGDCGGDEEN